MGNCCLGSAIGTKEYSNSIEKPLSEFQHHRTRSPDGTTNYATDSLRNPNAPPNRNNPSPTTTATAFPNLDQHGNPVQNEETLYSIGITKFNIKPRDGVQYLQHKNILGTTPLEVATFLCSRRLFRGRSTLQSGLNKKQLGLYLGALGTGDTGVVYHQTLLTEYIQKSVIPIKDVDIDEGLRTFLNGFVLPGEAQMIDRMVQGFAEWYHTSNPTLFQHQDTAHILAFGVIMLHTDAHNKQIKKKMTLPQFINMMKGIDQGKDLNQTMLKNVYARTVATPFALNHHEHGVVTFFNACREGWLWKSGSLKSPKRWNKRWFIINNHCLYYFKTKPTVGLDNTATCRCVIPLEDLRVKQKSSKRGKTREFSLRSSREGARLKTAKRNDKDQLVQGKHTKLSFRAETVELAQQWIDDIMVEMAPNPFLLHLQRRFDVDMDGEGGSSGSGGGSGGETKDSGRDSSGGDDGLRDDGQLMTDSEMETDDENDFGEEDNDGFLYFDRGDVDGDSSDPEDREVVVEEVKEVKEEVKEEVMEEGKEEVKEEVEEQVEEQVKEEVKEIETIKMEKVQEEMAEVKEKNTAEETLVGIGMKKNDREVAAKGMEGTKAGAKGEKEEEQAKVNVLAKDVVDENVIQVEQKEETEPEAADGGGAGSPVSVEESVAVGKDKKKGKREKKEKRLSGTTKKAKHKQNKKDKNKQKSMEVTPGNIAIDEEVAGINNIQVELDASSQSSSLIPKTDILEESKVRSSSTTSSLGSGTRSPTLSMSDDTTLLSLGKFNSSAHPDGRKK